MGKWDEEEGGENRRRRKGKSGKGQNEAKKDGINETGWKERTRDRSRRSREGRECGGKGRDEPE